jgi:hypothetical protein
VRRKGAEDEFPSSFFILGAISDDLAENQSGDLPFLPILDYFRREDFLGLILERYFS